MWKLKMNMSTVLIWLSIIYITIFNLSLMILKLLEELSGVSLM